MIFESKIGDIFAHVQITMMHYNLVDIFNQLISWKNKINS